MDYLELRQLLQARLVDRRLLSARRQRRSQLSPGLAYGRHTGPPAANAKAAAVMILLEPREGRWTIPLTVRPNHLPEHPGQISLPGGRLEHGESHLQAAKREFAEEMGVSLTAEMIGGLQPVYVFNSNYFVHPFLALSSQSLRYRPCQHEVARVIHLPVEQLLDPSSYAWAVFQRGLVGWRARAIQLGQDKIWGATAVMLGELSAVLQGISWSQIEDQRGPSLSGNPGPVNPHESELCGGGNRISVESNRQDSG